VWVPCPHDSEGAVLRNSLLENLFQKL
jgi:hypothetical protein